MHRAILPVCLEGMSVCTQQLFLFVWRTRPYAHSNSSRLFGGHVCVHIAILPHNFFRFFVLHKSLAKQ